MEIDFEDGGDAFEDGSDDRAGTENDTLNFGDGAVSGVIGI